MDTASSADALTKIYITVFRELNVVDAVIGDRSGEAAGDEDLERKHQQDGRSASFHLHGRYLWSLVLISVAAREAYIYLKRYT
jgi:hypothetical protein